MQIEPFKLERFFARHEFVAKYLLCSSDCESLTVQDLLAFEPAAQADLHRLWLGYTESSGHPGLRQAIAELYDRIDPAQVLVHTGAEEAIFNFMQAALQPGDHLVVHYPCYQSLAEIARASGCEVTLWMTREEDNWELDLNFLERSIRPATRAIIINSPHNPTGYLMSRERLEGIVALAQKHNLLLFSDEVYRFLEHDPADRLPAACDLYEKAVSLGVMSKTYGLAGLRIGWIATRNTRLYRQMATMKDYLTICNSAPSEFLATLALRHREKLVERNRNIVLDNLRLLDDFFARHSALFNWQRPRAGSIAFPSLRRGLGVAQFCEDLVRQKGVLLLPATEFKLDTPNFRIGFGRQNMPQALAGLEEFIHEQKLDG